MSMTFIPLSEVHRTEFMDILNYYSVNTYAAYPEMPLPYERFDFFLENAKAIPPMWRWRRTAPSPGSFIYARTIRCRPFGRRPSSRYFSDKASWDGESDKRRLGLLEEDAKKLGVRNIVSSISSRNEPSLAFHRKNGFRECGRLAGGR